MNKTLYLIRHGKAKSAEAGEKDRQRSLDSEGMRQATRIGAYLYKNDPMLSAIIASSATRAMETAEQLASQLGFDLSKIKSNEELYDASVRMILETVTQFSDLWNVVLIIGHNPALSYFVEYITGHHFEGMDTGSLVKISFPNESWQELSQGAANFELYLGPDEHYFAPPALYIIPYILFLCITIPSIYYPPITLLLPQSGQFRHDILCFILQKCLFPHGLIGIDKSVGRTVMRLHRIRALEFGQYFIS
ncbi:MAG: histidine phosphatase family protein [Cyclobacteriaceae bacterium]|nr:histidine phosphatase family protein [Cyclobacteriaceae bacterium]